MSSGLAILIAILFNRIDFPQVIAMITVKQKKAIQKAMLVLCGKA